VREAIQRERLGARNTASRKPLAPQQTCYITGKNNKKNTPLTATNQRAKTQKKKAPRLSFKTISGILHYSYNKHGEISKQSILQFRDRISLKLNVMFFICWFRVSNIFLLCLFYDSLISGCILSGSKLQCLYLLLILF
jgi:hypothetical protein